MGSNKDGNPITVEKNKDGSITYKNDKGGIAVDNYGKIQREANDDVKAIAKTFRELAKDGLSDEDKQTLSKIDKALKNANIVSEPDDQSITIRDNNYKTYQLLSEAVINDFKAGGKKGGRE